MQLRRSNDDGRRPWAGREYGSLTETPAPTDTVVDYFSTLATSLPPIPNIARVGLYLTLAFDVSALAVSRNTAFTAVSAEAAPRTPEKH